MEDDGQSRKVPDMNDVVPYRTHEQAIKQWINDMMKTDPPLNEPDKE
jgi:hypothetical protein